VLHAVGIVLAAATLCLTTATTANAASGTLDLNGKRIPNPSGCYNSDRFPTSIGNQTDAPVLVFDQRDCAGRVIEVVPPSGRTVSEFAQSVFVPGGDD
jgi:hypothetical protein